MFTFRLTLDGPSARRDAERLLVGELSHELPLSEGVKEDGSRFPVRDTPRVMLEFDGCVFDAGQGAGLMCAKRSDAARRPNLPAKADEPTVTRSMSHCSRCCQFGLAGAGFTKRTGIYCTPAAGGNRRPLPKCWRSKIWRCDGRSARDCSSTRRHLKTYGLTTWSCSNLCPTNKTVLVAAGQHGYGPRFACRSRCLGYSRTSMTC